MSNVMILYHGKCSDGFCAAWAAWKKFPDAEFVEVTYTRMKNFPDVTGKDVYILDFCFSREIMIAMKEKAKSILVLDHHQSAFENCGDLDFCTFDMKRSGAGMAWDYFHGAETRTWLTNYVEHRDLGGLVPNSGYPVSSDNFPDINVVLYAVDSYQQTFQIWDELSIAKEESFGRLVTEGTAIRRYAQSLVDRIVDTAYDIEINGHKGRVANTSVLQSEVANRLAERREFGMCWYQLPMKTKFSLRSKDGQVDVCKLSQTLPSGGGHKHASGFSGPKIDMDALIAAGREGEEDY